MAKKNTKKTAEQVAALICGRGQCVCAYNCGHSNKAPWAANGKLIGTETVCPLARYNVTPDTRPWFSIPADERQQLTLNDCWDFCAEKCEHAVVNPDGSIFFKDFEAACLDCPVKGVIDAITESNAEARMS